MKFLLKIVQGPNAGAEIALVEGVRVTLGSADACDIVLHQKRPVRKQRHNAGGKSGIQILNLLTDKRPAKRILHSRHSAISRLLKPRHRKHRVIARRLDARHIFHRVRRNNRQPVHVLAPRRLIRGFDKCDRRRR